MDIIIKLSSLENLDFSTSNIHKSRNEIIERRVGQIDSEKKFNDLNQGVNVHLIMPSEGRYSMRHLGDNFKKLMICIRDYAVEHKLDKVYDFKDKNNELGVNINKVFIDFDKFYPDDNQVRYQLDEGGFGQLREIEKLVNSAGGQMCFGDLSASRDWTVDDLVWANYCVDKLAKVIDDNNLSPFEAIFFLSNWIHNNMTYTSKAQMDVYKRGGDFEIFEHCNTIMGALKHLEIVCVGASQFVNAVLNKTTKFKSDELAWQTLNMHITRRHEGHSLNLVYINDPKYGIKGNCVVDATPFPQASKYLENKFDNNGGFVGAFDRRGRYVNGRFCNVHRVYSIPATLKRFKLSNLSEVLFVENKQNNVVSIDKMSYKADISEQREYSKNLIKQLKLGSVDEISKEQYSRVVDVVKPLLGKTNINMLKKNYNSHPDAGMDR